LVFFSDHALSRIEGFVPLADQDCVWLLTGILQIMIRMERSDFKAVCGGSIFKFRKAG